MSQIRHAVLYTHIYTHMTKPSTHIGSHTDISIKVKIT